MLAPAQNPLDLLRNRVIAEHSACAHALTSAIVHAMACGDLLREAKDQIDRHGSWLPFLTSCSISFRLAQKYMRLAKHRSTVEANASDGTHLSVTAAIMLIANPKKESAPIDLSRWTLDPLKTHREELEFAVGLVRAAFPDLNDEAVEVRARWLRFDAYCNGRWPTVEEILGHEVPSIRIITNKDSDPFEDARREWVRQYRKRQKAKRIKAHKEAERLEAAE